MGLSKNIPGKTFYAELMVPKIATFFITMRLVIMEGIVSFGITQWIETICIVFSLIFVRGGSLVQIWENIRRYKCCRLCLVLEHLCGPVFLYWSKVGLTQGRAPLVRD